MVNRTYLYARQSPIQDSHTYHKLQRILFLESIAGVPGMVAATLRHLKSLRLMVCSTYLSSVLCCSYVGNSHQRRDSGWIHTLLEEAENERMHLMFVG